MNEMQINDSMNRVFNIEGIDFCRDGNNLFVSAESTARGFGLVQYKKGVEYIRWETLNSMITEITGFPNKLGKGDYIIEDTFYKVGMRAKNETAKAFQDKVVNILKSIRKTGSYVSGQSDNDDDMAIINGYKALMRKVERLQSQIDLNKPKVEFADALLVCENCIYIEELAKLLCQIGMRTGRNRLFEEMAADGFLCVRNGVKNMPTQRCVEAGWLVIEKKTFEKGGVGQLGYTTKVTPKGIQYFIGYYKRKHGLEPVLSISKRSYNGVRQLKAGHSNS